MKLTPIPRKGKRKFKTKPTKQPQHAGERPSKLRRKLAARHGWDGVVVNKNTSLLDLPEWFLIEVFLTEKNFSFPRCSGRLGRILSHPYVFRRLIADAFGPTWDNWFGCAAEEVFTYALPPAAAGPNTSGRDGPRGALCRNGLQDLDRFGGDPDLQNRILEQRWLTADRLLQAQQVWLVTDRRGAPVYYRVPPPSERKSRRRRKPGVGREGFVSGRDFDVQAQFDLELAAAADAPRPLMLYPNMLEVHPATSFPDRLLTGPWTDADVALLFWLGRAGAVVSENQSWELVVEALDRMLALARLDRVGTGRYDRTSALVSRIVTLFEVFGIWDKVPAREWAALESEPNLGWLGDLLRAKTCRLSLSGGQS